MHRLVATVFKAIGISIVLIIIFEMGLYLVRVSAVVDRVDSMTTTLIPEVSKNNYLTAEAYNAYFGGANSVANNILRQDGALNGTGDGMLQEIRVNYSQELGSGDDLSVPVQYGNTRTVVIEFDLRGLDYTVNHTSDAANWVRGEREFTMRKEFTVPCLKYIRLQNA